MLKVGINSRYLRSPTSGIERYLQELLSQDSFTGVEYRQIEPNSKLYGFISNNSLLSRFTPFYHAFWDRYFQGEENIASNVDIIHGPSFVLPDLPQIPKVLTVHDLAFLRHPEFFDVRTKFYLNKFFIPSIHEANQIICVSRKTYLDFIEYFPHLKYKANIVYNGYSDFSELEERPQICSTLNLIPGEFLLTVGSFNPRKNINVLVDLMPQILVKHPHMKLVVVGRRPHRTKIYNENVIFTGHVCDGELASLYKNSGLFIFPSIYEGFGFPLLEAMSVGAKVIFSNNSSLPELVTLDDAFSFNPLQANSVCSSIFAALEARKTDFTNAYRSSLEKFSWGKMREETLSIYQKCF